ncbi:SPOR domain-containing protein [Kangiella sp. HZ709]|uniref:SPOR domain-containing protein n=1 Tax=Kangiella sp. HZ709 TaxID=2666328 RepID=UPI0012B0A8B9|nr:SPOR domain-containing protein [Kangiella sp. HZ709]MRX28564.1 hypothetical protein [Kangiella sp. HZ709]
MIVLGCSSRQAFQSQSNTKEDSQWWQCKPQTDREWHCAEGDKEFVSFNAQKNVTPSKSTLQTNNQATLIEQQVAENSGKDILDNSSQDTHSQDATSNNDNTVEEEPQITTKLTLGDETAVPNSQISNKELDSNKLLGAWTIQLGAFRQENQANDLSAKVKGSLVSEKFVKGQAWYRVNYGSFVNASEANKAASSLKQLYPLINTWVRKN